MSLIEKLPEELNQQIEACLTDGESIQLSVATDVTPNGDYGEEWLVATRQRALVFSRDEVGFERRLEFPLKELTEAKIEPMLGGGLLEACTQGQRIEIVHFSNSLAAKFGFVAKGLEQLAKDGTISVEVHEEEGKRCKSCGRPIPSHYGICPVCVDRSRTVRRIIRTYVKPFWKQAALASSLAIISTIAALVPVHLTRMLIDKAITPATKGQITIAEGTHLLFVLVGIFLAIQLFRSATDVWRGWLMAWLGGSVVRSVRDSLYTALQRLQLRFFDRRQTGQIISRVTRDTDALQWFMIDGLQMVSVGLTTAVGVIVVMLVSDWRLALVSLTPMPIVVFLSIVMLRRCHRLYHRVWHRWSDLSAVVGDSVSGIRVVKAFAQEKRETNRFSERNYNLFSSLFAAEKLFSIYWPAVGFAMGLGTLLVWLYGGWLILHGHLSLGVLVAFTMLQGMLNWPLQIMSRFPDWYQRAMTASERIFDVIDAKAEPYEADQAVPMPHIQGKVEFRNVTFGYDKHNPVLHDISISVEPGQMIGLVGHSGAGKSTVINLLCHFYEPNEGEILIDGVPLKDIKLDDLRSQIGVVPQEPYLFHGTIADNIAYGNKEAGLEEIIAAGRAANAHEFVMRFPDGYDTLAGERGTRCSQGERQRIAIARAILRNPRILIMDEATASVDTETERQIQEALDRLVKNRTTFAIAHRLSTLRNADKLMVMEKGRLVELGTHDELMDKPDGLYRKLVKMQREVSRIRAVGV